MREDMYKIKKCGRCEANYEITEYVVCAICGEIVCNYCCDYKQSKDEYTCPKCQIRRKKDE